jgi:predicted Zn-dependent protease
VAAWNEARELVDREAAGTMPQRRLVRALIYARGYDLPRRREALNELQALVEDLPSNSLEAFTARGAVVELLLSENRLPEAKAEAGKLVAQSNQANPAGRASAAALYAEILLRDGSKAEAAEVINRLVAIEPDSLRSIRLRARLKAAEGDMAGASALLEKAAQVRLSSAGGEVDEVAELAALAAGLPDLDAAERIARGMTEGHPERGFLLAELLLERKKPIADVVGVIEAAEKAGAPQEAVVTVLEKIIARTPAAELEPVDGLLGRLMAARPKSVPLMLLLAQLRHMQGRFDDEVAQYRQIEEIDGTNVVLLNNMAWTLAEELDKSAEALPYVDRAIEKIGRVGAILDTRGVILTRMGRLPEAIKDLEEATKAGASANTFFHLARAYQLAGQADKAKETRDEAKRLKLDAEKLSKREKEEWKTLEAL